MCVSAYMSACMYVRVKGGLGWMGWGRRYEVRVKVVPLPGERLQL